MTHEQWDKHHEVMSWFYAEKGRSVLGCREEELTCNPYWMCTSNPEWYKEACYVINDEYVEFRKAQVEGKVIEFDYDFIRAVSAFAPIKEPIERYALKYLRIKPDEPSFKVGDWVGCGKLIGKIWNIQYCTGSLELETANGSYDGKIKEFKQWTHQTGDVVVCWDDIDEERVVTKWRGVEVYDNIIPYIGQPLSEMK